MSKILITLCISLFSASLFSQNIEFCDFALQENLPDWVSLDKVEFRKKICVDRKINPFYLEADFNGDKEIDIAIFVFEKKSKKRGILIIHGKTFETFILGAGYSFGFVGDNFSFIDIWKVYKEPYADETMMYENNIVKKKKTILLNHAISVQREESTSNLIYWDGNNYNWLHTGD